MVVGFVVAALGLATWIVLIVGRGLFWIPRPTLEAVRELPGDRVARPSVCAVIPARNEQDVLSETLPSVLAQDYSGPLQVIVVDDRSDDATAAIACQVAADSGHEGRLTVVPGQELPAGWAGKVWAMHQGLQHAATADFIWLTDADIAHAPGVLSALADQAVRERCDLVSVMAQLRLDSFWDRLLIPAFVYFFAKLYPFRLVSNPRRRSAGAAGGCILVRRARLERAGGLAAIRSALIDDCALAELIQSDGGRLWLGFTRSVHSVRPYRTLRSTWDMVARSAFHQLGYSLWMLTGTVLGMMLLYVVPPVATVVGLSLGGLSGNLLAASGGVTWLLLSASFVPILRHQQSSPWLAPLLPLAGLLYTAMTLSSAWRHLTGRGGRWKGRTFYPSG